MSTVDRLPGLMKVLTTGAFVDEDEAAWEAQGLEAWIEGGLDWDVKFSAMHCWITAACKVPAATAEAAFVDAAALRDQILAALAPVSVKVCDVKAASVQNAAHVVTAWVGTVDITAPFEG